MSPAGRRVPGILLVNALAVRWERMNEDNQVGRGPADQVEVGLARMGVGDLGLEMLDDLGRIVGVTTRRRELYQLL